MPETGKIDNPTLKIDDYKPGSFVKWLMYGATPSFAVVVDRENNDLILRHFDGGFPFEVGERPGFGGMRLASRDEALAHFEAILKNFEPKIHLGGLPGAVSARKQHYLNGVIKKFKELNVGESAYYAST